MKKIIAIIAALLLCLSLSIFVGCSGNDGGDNETGGGGSTEIGGDKNPREKYELQIEKAEATYGNIYSASEKNGAVFAGFNNNSVRMSTFALTAEFVEEEPEEVTIETVREIVKSNAVSAGDRKGFYNSYVVDIFTYIQVQLAIINQYDIASLINDYNLTYDGLELPDSSVLGMSQAAYRNILPLRATFPGADLDTGKIYCEHSHNSRRGELVKTALEYYYNSENDMGVTTVNMHLNGDGVPQSFEYDYFDLGQGMVIIANAPVVDGVIGEITSFSVSIPNAYASYSRFSESDRQTIVSYIASETTRIYDKVENLKAANSAMEEELEVDKDQTVKSCNVTMDFSVLQKMLIK